MALRRSQWVGTGMVAAVAVAAVAATTLKIPSLHASIEQGLASRDPSAAVVIGETSVSNGSTTTHVHAGRRGVRRRRRTLRGSAGGVILPQSAHFAGLSDRSGGEDAQPDPDQPRR